MKLVPCPLVLIMRTMLSPHFHNTNAKSKSVGHFSEDAHDVKASLLGPGLPEEEAESMPSPRVLGEGLGLSDEEIQVDSGPRPLTLGSRVTEEGGVMGNDGEEVDIVVVAPSSPPTGLMRNLKASSNKDVQQCLEKERAVLPKLSTLSTLPPLPKKGPRVSPIPGNAHASMPEGVTRDTQGTEGPGTGSESAEGNDAVENSGGDADVDVADQPGDTPLEYLTTAQEKVMHDAFWKSIEDLSKTKAEELNVTASVIFRSLGALFAKESYRGNIWNSFQAVFRDQNPNIRGV
jgi:hypothetical protein